VYEPRPSHRRIDEEKQNNMVNIVICKEGSNQRLTAVDMSSRPITVELGRWQIETPALERSGAKELAAVEDLTGSVQ